jgi:hypothetical protein
LIKRRKPDIGVPKRLIATQKYALTSSKRMNCAGLERASPFDEACRPKCLGDAHAATITGCRNLPEKKFQVGN